MKNGSVKGRIVRIPECGQHLIMDEVEFPYPRAGRVRLRVEARGICHTDAHLRTRLVSEVSFPFVPGHEVVGGIDALGEGALGWRLGQRAGVGWHGGHCRVRRGCRRGNFVLCVSPKIPGLTYRAGYADYTIVPADALAAVPDELSSSLAAPLFCAGVTTALPNANAEPGDLVAVHGLGGLGHLGLQFAMKRGFRTAVIPRGSRKAAAAQTFGAHYHIDSGTQDVVKTLQDLRGAKLIVTAVSNSNASHRAHVAGRSPSEPTSVNHARTIHRRVRVRNRRRLRDCVPICRVIRSSARRGTLPA